MKLGDVLRVVQERENIKVLCDNGIMQRKVLYEGPRGGIKHDDYHLLCRDVRLLLRSNEQELAFLTREEIYTLPIFPGEVETTCKMCGRKTKIFAWQDRVCGICRNENHERFITENIKRGMRTYTACEDQVYCPYCADKIFHSQKEGNSFLTTPGDHVITCDKCGNSFSLLTESAYVYSTERMEDKRMREEELLDE